MILYHFITCKYAHIDPTNISQISSKNSPEDDFCEKSLHARWLQSKFETDDIL